VSEEGYQSKIAPKQFRVDEDELLIADPCSGMFGMIGNRKQFIMGQSIVLAIAICSAAAVIVLVLFFN